ncbi:MAG: WG repeat-containing protein [Moraxella sp.]|nr:WG repeat-containing protein [Moraxella sp.]
MKFYVIAVSILLMMVAHAHELSVINKDGLVELDCIRPTLKNNLSDVKVYCLNDDDIAIIEQENKQGLMDKNGRLISAIIYDDIFFLGDGVAKVKQDDKFGLLDIKTGKELTPIYFDDMALLHQNRIAVKSNKNWGYIDKKGRLVIALKYGSAFGFENGLAKVHNHGSLLDDTLKVGLVDLSGKEIFTPTYQSIHVMDDKVLFNTSSNLDGVADLNGNIIIEPEYVNISGFHDGYARFSMLNHELYGYLDETGQEVIEPQYQYAQHPHLLGDKMIFVVGKNINNNIHWGAVDKHNNTIIDFNYRKLSPQFGENIIIATNHQGKKLLLNYYGEPITTDVYDNIIGFSHGVSEYINNGKIGLINAQGIEITPTIYDGIKHEYNHDNKIFYGYGVRQGNKNGFLNPEGKQVLPIIYDEISNFHNGNLYLKQGNHYGIANILTGSIIVSPSYDDFRPLANGYTKAKQHNTWYLISPQGKNLGKTSAPK